jgi:hypothetical protein
MSEEGEEKYFMRNIVRMVTRGRRGKHRAV